MKNKILVLLCVIFTQVFGQTSNTSSIEYKTFEDFKNQKYVSSIFSISETSEGSKKFIIEKNNKVEKESFGFMLNNELYIRAFGIRNLIEDKGFSPVCNKRQYIKLMKRKDYYYSILSFDNTSLSLPLSIGGGIGAGLLAPNLGSAILIGGLAGGISGLLGIGKKVLIYNPKDNKFNLLRDDQEILSFLELNDSELLEKYKNISGSSKSKIKQLYKELD